MTDLLLTAPRLIPATAGSGVLAPGFVRVERGRVTAAGAGPPPRPPDIELPAACSSPAS